MDKEDILRKQSALRTLLDQMEVPESRKNTSREANIRWVARNLAVKNKQHPMFETTMGIVKQLIRCRGSHEVT